MIAAVGKHRAFLKALSEATLAAQRNAPVLIYGETGSGKGMLAEFIHRQSGRRGRFVSLNCATFQANLFESELFGYQKGAFTGAVKDTPGLFETASGGTLFLDEIGDMPLELQPKLLRALEHGKVRRVGGLSEIDVNARLVCATNRDLQELIREGRFREDLYYRINAFVVRLPALRDRPEDIPELAEHLLAQVARESGTPAQQLAPDALEVLLRHNWPGNVRELRSALAFAAAQAGRRTLIRAEDLPAHLAAPQVAARPATAGSGLAESLFAEVSRAGFGDVGAWGRFLLALNRALGDNLVARGDILPYLRALRGPEPTDNSLVNEWQRTVKPAALRLGLLREEGKKVRIDLAACEAAAAGAAMPPAPEEEITATAPPQPQPQRQRRTNIAPHRTSFVGREREAARLAELLLSGGSNLITVLGPGGTGKTRLAQEVARQVADRFSGGAWFADLTESRNIEGVAYAVARALGVPLTSSVAPEAAVAQLLESRGPTLLVLDNMEQVVRAAAGTVGRWARHAPDVRFLVTSRFVLGLEGETEFELQPLEMPAADADAPAVVASAAGRLFVDRARINHVNFTIHAGNAAAITAICRRLEGMPLAIELAAARVAIMQPDQIAERLDRLFALLKSTRRDLAPRQQSLTATIDWSHELLTPAEKTVFAQLSVFRGGFHLDAAEAVLDLAGMPDAPQVMDVIQSLREKSLLRVTDSAAGVHFSMYDAIREYAADKWRTAADAATQEALAARHARFFRDYLQQWDRRIFSHDAQQALARLELARANFEAAMEWCLASPERAELYVEYAIGTVNLFRVRGPARSRVPVLRRALELTGPADSENRLRVLVALGMAERESGDNAAANALTEESLQLAQRLNIPRMIGMVWFQLATISFNEGRIQEAQERHRKAAEFFRACNERGNEARVYSRMALALAHLGDYAGALEMIGRAEDMLRQADDLPGVAQALTTRSSILFHRSEFAAALQAVNAAGEIFARLDDKRNLAMVDGNRALLARQLRRLDESLVLMLRTGEQAAELGDLTTLATNHMNMGLLYLDLDRWDDAERAFADGARLAARQSRPHFEAVCRENLCLIRGLRGDSAGAIGELRALIAGLPPTDRPLRGGLEVTLAELLLMAGKTPEALQVAKSAHEHLTAAGITHNRDYFRALLALARANAACGDKVTAQQQAAQALKLAEALGFGDQDPSPRVRRDLQAARALA